MVGSPSSTENLVETPGAVAQSLHDEQLRKELEQAGIKGTGNDGNEDFGDPYPPPANATSEQKLSYSRAVNEYSREILDHLRSIPNLKGEELWIEYTCSFRKQTIKAISSTLQIDWARFLRSRGVFVNHKRGTPRWRSLQDCLEADTFVPATGATDDISQVCTVEEGNDPAELNVSHMRSDYVGKDPPRFMDKGEGSKVVKDRDKNIIHAHSKEAGPSSTTHGVSKRGPLEALMKAYQGRNKCSGSFDEDFEGAIEQFNKFCGILKLSDEEKLKVSL